MLDLVLNMPVYLHITGVMILVIAFFNRDLTRIFYFGLQKKRKIQSSFAFPPLYRNFYRLLITTSYFSILYFMFIVIV